MRALKPKAGIINNIWEIAFAPAKIIWKTLLTCSYYINKRQASVGFFPGICQRHTHEYSHALFTLVFTVVFAVFAAKVRFDKRGKCLIENYSEFVCAGLINIWSCLRINRYARLPLSQLHLLKRTLWRIYARSYIWCNISLSYSFPHF